MVESKEVVALDLARKIAIFNSEVVFYVKNSLFLMDAYSSKRLESLHEKYKLLVLNSFPKTDVGLIMANHSNNHNHDLTKLDVDLIKEMLLEGCADG